jgi:hypothetical protein
MKLLTEEAIDFVKEDDFWGREIVLVAKKITYPQGGRAHERGRAIAKGNAYCYEEFKVIAF